MGLFATLAVASLVLAFAASLPAVAGPSIRSGVVAYLAALVGGAFLVSLVVVRQPLMTPGKVSSVAKYAVQQLKAPPEKNVIVLQGASYVLNAVDVAALADELEDLGYSARAVKLAFGGANHFERYRLYEDIVQRLPDKPRDGQRWVYLTEVMIAYDRVPLNQLEKNTDSARAYHYLTLSNAWYAARAMQSKNLADFEFDDWQWTIARHSLVNAFNAGVVSRLVPEEEIEPVTGLASKGAPRFKFNFKELMKEAKNPGPPIPIPPWLLELREPRERELWGRFDPKWVYFGVPSTRPEQLRYIRSFCAIVKEPCVAPNEGLIESLEAPTNWRNAGHMNRNGAMIYTRWLAGEIARLGVLAK